MDCAWARVNDLGPCGGGGGVKGCGYLKLYTPYAKIPDVWSSELRVVVR